MDSRKLVILLLIVVAVIAYMALGAGLLRDREEGEDTPDNYNADTAMKRFEGFTGKFRSKFQLKWITIRAGPCSRDGNRITLSGGDCRLFIKPDSRRPTKFELVPGAGLKICFAFSEDKVKECVANTTNDDDPKLEDFKDDPAQYTVARDGAFLHFRCSPPAGGSSCGIEVTPK